MKSENENIYLSHLDIERFGIQIAKSRNLTLDILDQVLDFCLIEDVSLLITRCPVSDLDLVHELENHGFELMDTLVSSSAKLGNLSFENFDEPTIRNYIKGDETFVEDIARESFSGYFGHYHADKLLNRNICDEIYVDWAIRSCKSREVADEVLLAELKNKVVGFVTLRINNEENGEAVLAGVLPSSQLLGIYGKLISKGMHWCLSQGLLQMTVSTQITNIAVQKVWVRLGFEPLTAFYTFHKWFSN